MRIGINVPNELLQRLAPLKPELNISQVCREALEAKASSYERMRELLDDPAVQQAVARVWEREQEFRAVIAVDWERLGYEDAAAWVQAADWDDWDDLLEMIESFTGAKMPQWKIFPPVIDGVNTIGERWGELHERTRVMEQQDPNFRRWHLRQPFDPKANEQEYMTAWMAYTTVVWDLVQQRRAEHDDQLLAERAAERYNRPPPEAPAHLLPAPVSAPEPQPEKPPFRVVPHHGKFAPGVAEMNLNHLAAELDDELYFAKMERDLARERELQQEKPQ